MKKIALTAILFMLAAAIVASPMKTLATAAQNYIDASSGIPPSEQLGDVQP